MGNHVHPHGGAWALKDPFLHTEANAIVEALLKSPNFDEGSAHAPTADIELSGAMGGGFSFDDAFPFFGDLDVTNGLTLDAPVGGSVIFGDLVAVDVRGPLSFTTTGTGTATWQSGTNATFNSGSTLNLSSGATANLTGTTLVRGTLTIRNSGGPGALIIETGCDFQVDANADVDVHTNDWRWLTGSVETHESGATSTWNSGSTVNVSGVVNFKTGSDVDFESGASVDLQAGATLSLSGAVTFAAGTWPLVSSRPWKRRAKTIAVTTFFNAGADGPDDPDMWTQKDPSTAAPTFITRPATATGCTTTLEFEQLPAGATISSVTIKGDGTTITAPTFPTYRVVRWRAGDDGFENMSSIVTDSHNGFGDWGVNPRDTTLTVTAHAVVDPEYRYGLRISHPYAGATSQLRIFDCYAEGSMTSMQQ